jgi:Restriction endonuclease
MPVRHNRLGARSPRSPNWSTPYTDTPTPKPPPTPNLSVPPPRVHHGSSPKIPRDSRHAQRDVNKFLAESGRAVFAYGMLIATTNLIDRIGKRTIQDQEKRVTFFRLTDLQAADVNWPASPTAS